MLSIAHPLFFLTSQITFLVRDNAFRHPTLFSSPNSADSDLFALFNAQPTVTLRCLRWPEHQDPRHSEQPDPQVAPVVADDRWPSVLPDPRHRRGVGRSAFRREADAARAMYATANLQLPAHPRQPRDMRTLTRTPPFLCR